MQLTLNYCDIADVFEITPPIEGKKNRQVKINIDEEDFFEMFLTFVETDPVRFPLHTNIPLKINRKRESANTIVPPLCLISTIHIMI